MFEAIALEKGRRHWISRLLRAQWVWLWLSLGFSLLYSGLALREGYAGAWVVQDDARQHVFWMARFVDSTLLQDDLIADYFQSVAPAGYQAMYQMAIALGLDLLTVNKLLPTLIGLLTTLFTFKLSLELLPIPVTGWLATLMLNQALWLDDDVVSATPRAFAYVLLLAFLYFYQRRWVLPCLLTLVVQSVVYPICVLVSAGFLVLRLVTWDSGKLCWASASQCRFSLYGLAVAFLSLLPFALQTSPYGPVVTAAEARQMPEFFDGGRVPFFHPDAWEYWLGDSRSGLLPRWKRLPEPLIIALGLPVVLMVNRAAPLVAQVRLRLGVLLQLVLASVGWYVLARVLLFQLHLPSRYTKYSVRIVLALTAAIALTLLLDAIWRWARFHTGRPRLAIATATTAVLVMLLVAFPVLEGNFPKTNYRQAEPGALYEYLAQVPANSQIASLSLAADNIPMVSRRSVLFSYEYGIPYHLGYYRQYFQRGLDTIEAQFTPRQATLIDFNQRYDIDYWLVEITGFEPDFIAENGWLRQFQPAFAAAKSGLERGDRPAMASTLDDCSVYSLEQYVVLDAHCMSDRLRSRSPSEPE